MTSPRWAGTVTGLGLALLLTGCASTVPGQPDAGPTVQPLPRVAEVDSAEVTDAIGADDALGLDLLAAESARHQGNLALSPLSVATALQMAAGGADGTTATELAHVLHLPNAADAGPAGQAAVAGIAADATPDVTLRTANTLWTQHGMPLLPAFSQGLTNHFGTTAHETDFTGAPDAARQRINTMVADQTGGRIRDLFPSGAIDGDTRLVLTNALALSAAWTKRFDRDATTQAPFTTGTGAAEQVPMMSGEIPAGYATGPGYQVITLPYAGNRLGFSILLPAPGSTTANLLTGLRATGLGTALRSVRHNEVVLSLPKFHLRSAMDLKQSLSALGMADAFTANADFDRITTQRPVRIQQVEHEADIQVDENGTVAAAATGISAGAGAAAPAATVRVDRPFLFAITDTETGLSLFLGRVDDPNAS